MERFLVLNEYAVRLARHSDCLSGSIDHHSRDGTIVPAGYMLGYIEEATELRPKHWAVHLFFRMGLRYDQAAKTTVIVVDALTPSGVGWHLDLPHEIGTLLLREGLCSEPMALHVNRFQERGGNDFGRTWIEDDDM